MSTAGHSVHQCLAADSENALPAGMAYMGPIADVPSVLAQLGADVEEVFAEAAVDLSLCEHRNNQISALKWKGFFCSALTVQCARISGFWSGSRLTSHRSDHLGP